jgi:hypothetical protein
MLMAKVRLEWVTNAKTNYAERLIAQAALDYPDRKYVIGDPEPNPHVTVKQLLEMDIVGIYEERGPVGFV